MNYKKWLIIALGSVGLLLLGSSIYVDFIAKSSKGLTYLLIGQIFVGIAGSLLTLFLGLNAFPKKKNHELLFIAFLELVFVLGLVTLNYVCGYGNVINRSDYIDYMAYVSMEFNIYIYVIFIAVIGLLDLNLYLKEKLSITKETNENIEEALK